MGMGRGKESQRKRRKERGIRERFVYSIHVLLLPAMALQGPHAPAADWHNGQNIVQKIISVSSVLSTLLVCDTANSVLIAL